MIGAACSGEAPDGPTAVADATKIAGAETAAPGPAPGVTIAADPAPPFAYWAPEGSVIRNHPSSPGIWIAEGEGEVVYYFGDACGASRYQIDTVGTDRATIEDLSPEVEVRDYVQGDVLIQNLVPTRINIERDGPGGRILSISCG
ncbi:hypothetical protein [Brevundimonas sp.]|uniref:hypothetical protein n=1 Tax=Brevundimonas sp. TaxID=1871086 RepID=UPI0035B2FB48